MEWRSGIEKKSGKAEKRRSGKAEKRRSKIIIPLSRSGEAEKRNLNSTPWERKSGKAEFKFRSPGVEKRRGGI